MVLLGFILIIIGSSTVYKLYKERKQAKESGDSITRKWSFTLFLALFVLIIGIGMTNNGLSDAESENKTEQSTEKKTVKKDSKKKDKLKEEKPTPKADNLKDITTITEEIIGKDKVLDVVYHEDNEPPVISVELDLGMGLTAKSMLRDIQYRTSDLMEALRDAGHSGDFQAVWMYNHFTDDLGNESTGKIYDISIWSNEFNAINYDNFNPQNLEKISDVVFVHPSLRN